MIAKRHILLLLLLTAGLLLTGCSSRALHEAQGVVAEADSLRAEGVAYTVGKNTIHTTKQMYGL